MPRKSLTSSVLRWPDKASVEAAVRAWAAAQSVARAEVVRIGVFGSYARGDAGVGSDLDLVAVVRSAPEPFERRAASWDLTTLPVPAELLVFTDAEWAVQRAGGGRFWRVLSSETKWLVGGAGRRPSD